MISIATDSFTAKMLEAVDNLTTQNTPGLYFCLKYNGAPYCNFSSFSELLQTAEQIRANGRHFEAKSCKLEPGRFVFEIEQD